MATPGLSSSDQPLLISYMTLRKLVGVLGIALPFVVALGAWLTPSHLSIQSSISGYYYTDTRNVFVGILWAIGVFLLAYKGYGRADDVAGNIACFCALGVALVPTDPSTATHTSVTGMLHRTFASLFFLTLAYFSLVLFTKTDQMRPTPQKMKRNKVYRVCGTIMLAAMILILVRGLLPDHVKNEIEQFAPVFWLEAVAIIAFGVSWLVKGEAIFGDKGNG